MYIRSLLRTDYRWQNNFSLLHIIHMEHILELARECPKDHASQKRRKCGGEGGGCVYIHIYIYIHAHSTHITVSGFRV